MICFLKWTNVLLILTAIHLTRNDTCYVVHTSSTYYIPCSFNVLMWYMCTASSSSMYQWTVSTNKAHFTYTCPIGRAHLCVLWCYWPECRKKKVHLHHCQYIYSLWLWDIEVGCLCSCIVYWCTASELRWKVGLRNFFTLELEITISVLRLSLLAQKQLNLSSSDDL